MEIYTLSESAILYAYGKKDTLLLVWTRYAGISKKQRRTVESTKSGF